MRVAGTWIPFLLLTLVACGSGGGGDIGADPGASEQSLRPADSPDVVVFSVSGHAPGLSAITCTSADNRPYLGDADGGRAPIEQAFLDLGYTVESIDFSDRLVAQDTNGSGALDDGDYLGFDQLLVAMQFVHTNYMDGFDNPTRIVLVGHSHGATWMHLATAAVPHIPVDHLISLDAICFLWPCEHAAEVLDWLQSAGLDPLIDLSDPCDSVAVEGTSALQNVKDVAFDHVRYNLEIQSSDFLTSDCCSNHRVDGTTTGIATWQAPESHGTVDGANSDAIAWVVDQIRQIDASR